MKDLLFKKIRLTYYFVILFVLFMAVIMLLPSVKFESGALMLFSVNSFLYGFYISPILSAQKARVEELHKIIRSEANAIFAMVLGLKKLPKKLRNEIQGMFMGYLKLSIKRQRAGAGEVKYESMISYF